MQEKSHPGAFAAAASAHLVHAVVPVTRAHQGQPMGAKPREGVVEPRAQWPSKLSLSREVSGTVASPSRSLGPAAPRERARRNRGSHVAGSLDVTSAHIGKPKMRVGGVGAVAEPGPAVWRPMPPLHRVALEELMRGMQQDLRARALRARNMSGITSCNWSRSRSRPIVARGRCDPKGATRAADTAASR